MNRKIEILFLNFTEGKVPINNKHFTIALNYRHQSIRELTDLIKMKFPVLKKLDYRLRLSEEGKILKPQDTTKLIENRIVIEGIPKNPDKGTLATSIPPVPTGRKPPAPRVSPPLKAEKRKAPTPTPQASATSSQKSTKSPLKPQESKANTQRVELESSSSSDEEPPAKKPSTQKAPSPQKTLSSPPKTTAPPGGRARKASTAHMPPALRKIPETPKPVDAKEDDDDEPPVRRCSSYRYAKLEELTDLPLVRDVLAFKLMELQEIQGHKVSKLSDFKEGRVSSVDERLALVQLDLTEPIKIPEKAIAGPGHVTRITLDWNSVYYPKLISRINS